MKTITVHCLIIGCIAVALVASPNDDSHPVAEAVVTKEMIAERKKAIAAHWAVVRGHKKFVTDANNFKPDPKTGLRVATPPDPEPSLAYLVSVGELEHVDLVFPTVPKTHKTNRFWVKWEESTNEVWHMTGNPQYVDYKPAGEQPLHLNIWFEASAKPKVQQLIKELESLAKEGG